MYMYIFFKVKWMCFSLLCPYYNNLRIPFPTIRQIDIPRCRNATRELRAMYLLFANRIRQLMTYLLRRFESADSLYEISRCRRGDSSIQWRVCMCCKINWSRFGLDALVQLVCWIFARLYWQQTVPASHNWSSFCLEWLDCPSFTACDTNDKNNYINRWDTIFSRFRNF